jgi:hypothetical protein
MRSGFIAPRAERRGKLLGEDRLRRLIDAGLALVAEHDLSSACRS